MGGYAYFSYFCAYSLNGFKMDTGGSRFGWMGNAQLMQASIKWF
jgi:hypothetical protein